MSDVIRIGNASAFWGDDPDAAARLVAQAPELDYLTLDYLAEVTMSILARQREKDPKLGYARDFVDVVRSLVPAWAARRTLKVVANAGGLNPAACAEQCVMALRSSGLKRPLTIGIVAGDDVLPRLRDALATDPNSQAFGHLESGQPLATVGENLVTANAYIGAGVVADALRRGADVVITGRVADPSLVVGCCAAAFDWPAN